MRARMRDESEGENESENESENEDENEREINHDVLTLFCALALFFAPFNQMIYSGKKY
jgi:hypothetical protein